MFLLPKKLIQSGFRSVFEYQLARAEDARKRAEAREQEKVERQKRLEKVIIERKQKELADKAKYNWIDSDEEDYEKKKAERRQKKKSRKDQDKAAPETETMLSSRSEKKPRPEDDHPVQRVEDRRVREEDAPRQAQRDEESLAVQEDEDLEVPLAKGDRPLQVQGEDDLVQRNDHRPTVAVENEAARSREAAAEAAIDEDGGEAAPARVAALEIDADDEIDEADLLRRARLLGRDPDLNQEIDAETDAQELALDQRDAVDDPTLDLQAPHRQRRREVLDLDHVAETTGVASNANGALQQTLERNNHVSHFHSSDQKQVFSSPKITCSNHWQKKTASLEYIQSFSV
ncbi:Oidioi.mRNA.OKI2018_I69.XSR.g16706.t1.cds [Oikopleura dioica]|uniref:Oidioi.mRNA.OKI2018_I69.XSR.g16706.t1.cds n=1 Tax=Oikopleura dioica TaxID=34765 RepID=A0ABN7SKW8_OIKDI|nr:Oidioi.mRNA.OKI2018_I69.XSR.g16706.t1.cds [Oikopleura dioica]